MKKQKTKRPRKDANYSIEQIAADYLAESGFNVLKAAQWDRTPMPLIQSNASRLPQPDYEKIEFEGYYEDDDGTEHDFSTMPYFEPVNGKIGNTEKAIFWSFVVSQSTVKALHWWCFATFEAKDIYDKVISWETERNIRILDAIALAKEFEADLEKISHSSAAPFYNEMLEFIAGCKNIANIVGSSPTYRGNGNRNLFKERFVEELYQQWECHFGRQTFSPNINSVNRILNFVGFSELAWRQVTGTHDDGEFRAYVVKLAYRKRWSVPLHERRAPRRSN